MNHLFNRKLTNKNNEGLNIATYENVCNKLMHIWVTLNYVMFVDLDDEIEGVE